jgi:hypothetical protein
VERKIGIVCIITLFHGNSSWTWDAEPGVINCRAKPGMPFQLGYICGKRMQVFEFSSRRQMLQWDAAVHRIKLHSAAIHEARLKGETRGDIEDYRHWIEDVHSFIAGHGKEYVPQDIQEALNQIEENCGIVVTTWTRGRAGCVESIL